MADLSSVVPSATIGGNTEGPTPAGFAGLLADVSAGGLGSQRVIEQLMEDDPDSFYRGALAALRTGEESRGLRFLVGLLVTHDALEPLLCEASLPVDGAAAAVRVAIHLDPTVETSLARHVAEGVTTGRHPLVAAHASRLLDILARVSDGTRILPSLSRLLHSSDVGLRSKAALIMGRSNRSAVWVQSRMTDADPRLRANAIEGLWGVETEEARDLMMSSLHDTNNRVIGNALYGLYSMGEAACLAETVKLAAHPVAVFRSTAAWVMGETGDSRFRLPVAQLLRDEHPMVRSRALWAVARIKAATAHAITGPPWLLSNLLLETPGAISSPGPKTMRHVQVAINAAGFAQPPLRAIQFLLTEDGQPVLNYRLTVRPNPPPMSVVFLFPRGGEAEEPPWVTAALGCLAGKRSSDMWAYLPWMPTSEAAGPVTPDSQENQEIPFTPNHDALADSFRRMASRSECGDMWQTLWRALRSESNMARGRRHVIVLASEEVRGVAGHGLVATVGAARGIVQVISAVPNPALETLCGKTRIGYTYAPTPELIAASVERAYLNLNARYELCYQTLSTEARELKIRIQSPTGWGESTVAIPPPAT